MRAPGQGFQCQTALAGHSWTSCATRWDRTASLTRITWWSPRLQHNPIIIWIQIVALMSPPQHKITSSGQLLSLSLSLSCFLPFLPFSLSVFLSFPSFPPSLLAFFLASLLPFLSLSLSASFFDFLFASFFGARPVRVKINGTNFVVLLY